MNDAARRREYRHKEREPLFDMLRGVAVLFMIAAHAIFFFHTGTNETLRMIERIGNATVFTMLLLVSGMVTYWAYFTGAKHRDIAGHVLSRVVVIYTGYAVVAFAAIVTDPSILTLNDQLFKFVSALVLRDVPSFSEFLLPFLFYPLTVLLVPGFYRWLVGRLRYWFMVAVISYAAGMWLFVLDVPWAFTAYKALLAGSEGALRFPLLQYFPVFSLGILWGSTMLHKEPHEHIVPLYQKVFATGTVVVLCGIIGIGYGIPVIDPMTRWPPSVGFLVLGVFATLVTALVLMLIPKLKLFEWFWRILAYVGADSFDLYITHLILLYAYNRFAGIRYDNPLAVGVLTVGLFIASIFLSSVNWKASPSVFTLGPISITNVRRYRIKKRYLVSISVIAAFVLLQFSKPGSPAVGGFLEKEDIVSPPEEVSVSLSRQWYVKEPGSPVPPLTITLTKEITTDASYTYDIPLLNLRGDFAATSAAIVSVSLPLGDPPEGEYQITVDRNPPVPDFPLYESRIYITQPLYVSWTLDWEGWDVEDAALREIEAISREYGKLPVTHFFNPRIFIPEVVSRERAGYLVSWLKERLDGNQDEVALHLHMHYDLLTAAGLTPRTEPSWKYLSESGYDVYTTAYSRDEIKQLISWSVAEFEKNGLPRPAGYRAGGWYADGNVLQAVADSGFLYDASGRERPQDGPFRNIPWDLDMLTTPYYPSILDQNTQSDEHLPILEIPNNGLDTFSYQPFTLLQRYYANNKGGILKEPRVLTYVSHPQWYRREFPKIQTVLSTVAGNSARDDRGPVVFVTQAQIYEVWK